MQNRIIERLASRSHGVVTRAQLLAAGISVKEIEHRIASGSLIPAYPGVYRVGHRAPSLEASYLAAVLACGPGALLCGRAAAHLQEVIRSRLSPPPAVVAPTERRVDGIQISRSRVPLAPDAGSCRGIPVTKVPRTLVDLAAVLSLPDLARAFHEAEIKHGTTPAQVTEVLERRPNAKGARNVRLIVCGDAPVLLSRLERRFRELLVEHGLPLPETNKRVGNRYVDCRWKRPPLIVELDSYRFHHSRHAWEMDHRREREARACGNEYRRYTWHDVFEDERLMLADLQAILDCTPRRGAGQDRAAA